jgi:putative ABC transport system permease protein
MNPRLAILLLWRDWRSGELTLLLASLVIAVGTVTTITLFVDRLQRALLQESAAFLAADRVVSSSAPIDPAIIERATSIGLRQSETLSFLSMVFAEDRAQFASVKAVSAGYPLRGRLNVSGEAFVRGRDVFAGPEPGRVWLESRLFASLDIAMGDELEVGAGSFIVDQVLIAEPDRGGGFNAAGPRVMMHMSDVPKTRVVQP